MECNELYFYDDLLFTHVIHEIKFLRHRVLLLVDIIWIGVISHNITNFQGRRFLFHFSGGSRGGARPPLSFLDQTEARKVENIFLETGPSPLSKDLDDRSPPPPLISRSVSGTALVSQVSRAGLNNDADNFAWTSLKLSTLVLTGLPSISPQADFFNWCIFRFVLFC